MITIPIEIIAAVPWEKLTAEEACEAWRALKAGDWDHEYLQADYEPVGSYTRAELGE